MKTLKIKINECNIKSLLLAFYFSKFNYEIYIYDPIKKNTSCDFDEKFFTITNSTKFILEELELWNKLQTKIYGFNSFSFINRFFNQEILISKIDMFNKDKHNENIGWILKYSDLKELLINKLSNNLNIKFLNSGFIQKKCDYEFHFEDFNEKISESNKKIPFIFQKSRSTIVFKVMFRGDSEGRLYEIFRENESILMIPLSRNIYQIIWKGKIIKSKDRINTNVNLLLDNLSTLVPSELKIDQIVGEINFIPYFYSSPNTIKFHNNHFYFNNFNKITSHFLIDDFKSLFLDLDFLKRNLIKNRTANINYFINFKNNFYLKNLLVSSYISFLKKFAFEELIRFKVIPDLLKNSQILKFYNQFILKKFFIKFIIKKSFE